MRNIKAYRFCLESRANKLKHEAAATQKEGSKEKLQFADKKELPFIREKACERASSFPSSSQKRVLLRQSEYSTVRTYSELKNLGSSHSSTLIWGPFCTRQSQCGNRKHRKRQIEWGWHEGYNSFLAPWEEGKTSHALLPTSAHAGNKDNVPCVCVRERKRAYFRCSFLCCPETLILSKPRGTG